MAPVIPGYCVFKTKDGDKYLRAVKEGTLRRYIRADGDDIFDPLSKLTVQRAKSNKEFVHIRCFYTNKYWRRSQENEYCIFAGAEAVEEDKTKWSCTLFKPLTTDDVTFRFQHVQSGHTVFFLQSNDQYKGCLSVGENNNGQGALFTITDWESLVILPKHVAIKGNNGKYLRHRGGGHDHLEFGATDIGDNRVGDIIINNPDGTISVKHNFNGKFWKATPNWIYPIANEYDASDASIKFWPVKLEDDAIALRSMGNDRYLRNTDYADTTNCLAAASWATTIDRQSHLVIQELVKKRQIFDAVYRLEDARIHSETVLSVARSCVTNMTQQKQKMNVSLTYTNSEKYEWSNSTTISSSMSMSVSLGVPKITETKIEVSKSFEDEYEWGNTKDGSKELKKSISIDVPPMSKTTITLMATLGSCDVPFSYTQQDTLTNGEIVAAVKNDGLYRGVNTYNFRTETKNEDL